MFIQEHKNLWKYGASLGALVDYVSYMIGSLRYISQLTKLTSYIDKEDIILDWVRIVKHFHFGSNVQDKGHFYLATATHYHLNDEEMICMN